eukprot:15443001-Alexandrium_andersonii.AAC.1
MPSVRSRASPGSASTSVCSCATPSRARLPSSRLPKLPPPRERSSSSGFRALPPIPEGLPTASSGRLPPQVTFLRNRAGELRAEDAAIDGALAESWGPIFDGNVDSLEGAAQFFAQYAADMVVLPREPGPPLGAAE